MKICSPFRRRLTTVVATIGLAACALTTTQARAQNAPAASLAAPLDAGGPDYRLGVADKVRLIVFNEPTLSGSYTVGADGDLAVPLIGDVKAADRTTTQLTDDLQRRFSAGYLRNPRVSIEVVSFRPFYILGEIKTPGEYPFSSGLTVFNAVATAQGFTYRADMKHVYIRRAGQTSEEKADLTSMTPVHPGDTIRIGERYF